MANEYSWKVISFKLTVIYFLNLPNNFPSLNHFLSQKLYGLKGISFYDYIKYSKQPKAFIIRFWCTLLNKLHAWCICYFGVYDNMSLCDYLWLLSDLGLLFTSLSQWRAAHISHPWCRYQSSDQLQRTQPTRPKEVYGWLEGVHRWGAGDGEIQDRVWASAAFLHNLITKPFPETNTSKTSELSFFLCNFTAGSF